MSSEDFEGHIPRLQRVASYCDTAAEFGVRSCDGTTVALISGIKKTLYSYDINNCEHLCGEVRRIAHERGVGFVFTMADSTTVQIPEVDLLFIDTVHSYAQLTAELANASRKARWFIGFHDTVTFWSDDGFGGEGMGRAIEEFMVANPQWVLREEYTDWHGMMILENRNALDLPDIPAA